MKIFGIKLIPPNTPLKIHLQTLAAALWMLSIGFGGLIGLIVSLYLMIFTRYKYLVGIYLLWIWIIDNKTPENGGRRIDWVRSWSWWKHVKEYFPFHFETLPGVNLDPKKSYLFCGFPHGFIPSGAVNGFLSDHSEFKDHFPYHTPYMVTLNVQLALPIGRELLLSLGGISSSAKSIGYVLSRPEGGNAVCLMVGGAREVFFCKPGAYRIILKNRKGFIRLALHNGASLVPFFVFGETDLYDQLDWAWLRNWQERIRRWIGMTPAVLIGRGFFQYSFGIIPRNCPVTIMELFGIKFAPLNVPMKRRLETLGAAVWISTIVFSGVSGSFLAIYLIMYTRLRWITVLYLFWIWFIDNGTSEKGGRHIRWVRSWPSWEHARDYFPCKLEKVAGLELDPKRNYLFCTFPHGVLPAGATIGFGTEFGGYKTHFPYHIPHIVTLSIQFLLPFGRDLIMALGGISLTPKSIEYVLSGSGGGHICVLAVGGTKEAVYSKPGSYRVALKNRKGFVKLALRNGSPLVPVVSFGEPDLFGQPGGRVLKGIQEFLRKWTIVAPVIPIGRGFFQYSFGILPRRRPVTTIVGEPMDVPKIAEPTKEQIDEYHGMFVEKLTQLFEEQKYKYLEKPDVTKLIID